MSLLTELSSGCGWWHWQVEDDQQQQWSHAEGGPELPLVQRQCWKQQNQ